MQYLVLYIIISDILHLHEQFDINILVLALIHANDPMILS